MKLESSFMGNKNNFFHDEIPIMHCFDNNYVIPAAVSFYSMLEHADQAYFYRLFVLHNDITVQNQTKLRKLVRNFSNADIEFINMDNRFEDIWEDVINSDHLAKEVLYKLIAPSIFQNYERIIITDVDVVFLGDIAPSYFALSRNPKAYFAGVHQINPDKSFLRSYYNGYKVNFSDIEYNQIKICGGFLVSNLQRQREDGMTEVFISYLKNNATRLLQAEQDVINFCCRSNQILILPLNFVVCSYIYDICTSPDICASDPHYTYNEIIDAMENPIQLHFATASKPWIAPNSTKAEIWHYYLAKTDFYFDYEAKRTSTRKEQCETYELLSYSELAFAPSIKASVLICSYNHEMQIAQAIQSVLSQKTNFVYEIIIADDASTDRTQEIIRSLQIENPDKIEKCILRTENIGIGQNYYDALTLVEGEYLALCDGDDSWSDVEKLQKQIDFLESNQDYTIVCSDFTVRKIEEGKVVDELFEIKQYLFNTCGLKEKYTLEDLIFSRFIASCTATLRWKLKGRVPEFLKEYSVIDFPLMLIHASCGFIKVFDEPMAIHNIHTNSISNSAQKTVYHDTMMVLHEVNQFLNYRITPLVNAYLNLLKPVSKQNAIDSKTLNSVFPKKLALFYETWVPELCKRVCRLAKKGVFFCYREIIPIGVRRIAVRFITKLKKIWREKNARKDTSY